MIVIAFPLVARPISFPVQISNADAEKLGQALLSCLGLSPGETAQRLGAVFASLEAAQMGSPVKIDTVPVDEPELPADPSPPEDPLAEVFTNPAPVVE